MKNRKNSNHPKKGEVRIIGGDWRSRKLLVPDVDGLRPTTDRIRETVFNWLQTYIVNSQCLDVCAGSGALGFEALSRGANKIHFVETNKKAIQAIEQNAQNLEVNTNGRVIVQKQAVLDFLAENIHSQRFDVVFVDPPFALNLHEAIFKALEQGDWLAENALIYCEMPANETLELSSQWEWFREKRSKNVAFGLIAV